MQTALLVLSGLAVAAVALATYAITTKLLQRLTLTTPPPANSRSQLQAALIRLAASDSNDDDPAAADLFEFLAPLSQAEREIALIGAGIDAIRQAWKYRYPDESDLQKTLMALDADAQTEDLPRTAQREQLARHATQALAHNAPLAFALVAALLTAIMLYT